MGRPNEINPLRITLFRTAEPVLIYTHSTYCKSAPQPHERREERNNQWLKEQRKTEANNTIFCGRSKDEGAD